MRTTVSLEPEVERLVSHLSAKKRLSRFINQCIKEHFRNGEKKRLENELAFAYRRANKEGEEIRGGFEHIEIEGWPEW